ncbi:MAG: MFS transporter [Candidatus Nomurabacteria bacterium]|nr:MAG: MFS transporter [Candidatus Nomurabacteria bacterium]
MLEPKRHYKDFIGTYKKDHPLRPVYFGSFIFSIGVSLLAYINSGYIASIVGENKVGIVYSLSSLLTIFFLYIMPRLEKRFGNRNILVFLSILGAISILLSSSSAIKYLSLSLFVIYLVSVVLIPFSIDIFVERFTNKKEEGKTRGLFLTVLNLAWLSGPLVAGTIISKNGFSSVSQITALSLIIVATIFSFTVRDFKDPYYRGIKIKETIKNILGKKDILLISFSNLLLQIFYAVTVIYIPIYLNTHIGMGWKEIGLILTVMLVPFVLLDYPLGKLSDTKLGEKELLFVGFMFISVSTLFISTIHTNEILPWMIVLFSGRIGASIVEAMNEIYFFKKIDIREAGLISVFRGASPLGYLIGPLFGAFFISFFSIQSVFVSLGIITLAGLVISLLINDTK